MLLRQTLHYMSRRKELEKFLRKTPLARQAFARFTAGDSLDEALKVARRLNETGLGATLVFLGEEATDHLQAYAAADAYAAATEQTAAAGMGADLSVRLSRLGLLLDGKLACRNLLQVVQRAEQTGQFVRVEMETSTLTEQAVDVVRKVRRLCSNVGTTIPAHLRRSSQDVEILNKEGISVRLVKGGYLEPEAAAFQDTEEISLYFMRLLEALFRDGCRPAIATHDEKLIEYAIDMAFIFSRSEQEYEFQMLYGVRPDLQERLREEGYKVRIYIPYGPNWYDHLVRHMADRPATLWSLLCNRNK